MCEVNKFLRSDPVFFHTPHQKGESPAISSWLKLPLALIFINPFLQTHTIRKTKSRSGATCRFSRLVCVVVEVVSWQTTKTI